MIALFSRERHASSASVCIGHTVQRKSATLRPCQCKQQLQPWSGTNQPVGSRQPPDHCSRVSTLYQPIPAHGHYQGGNLQQTTRMKQAFAKLLVHSALTSISGLPTLLGAALTAPAKFRATLPSQAQFTIIWDSGASLAVSPDWLS